MMAPEDEELWGVIIPGQIGLQDLQNQFHVREVAVLEGLLAPQDGAVTSGGASGPDAGGLAHVEGR